jgi:outer membrane lipopolysaccharide assembly protein LptE/RlpB
MSELLKIRNMMAVAAIFLLLPGCGYHPISGTIPGGGSVVHVKPATNETPFPGLASPITSALRKRLVQAGIEVVGSGHGAPRIEIRLVEVDSSPGMLTASNGRLKPMDTIWSIAATVTVSKPGAPALAGPRRFEVKGRSFSGDGVLAEESLGERRRVALIDDLVDQIVADMFEH